MRASRYLLATLKEVPADAQIASHRLMLRAGLIRQLAAGLYSWLPLGVRVLRKVEAIVREEMNRAGAQELLMPVAQPANLWQESGRWEQFGPELLRFQDRHARDFCLGPTHEEVITDLVRNEVKSYRHLPACFYQIQTKFRDEVRPRFGVMRAREFLMKDAYSFHLSEGCLQQTYAAMHRAYCAIFDRIGFDYRAVLADSGSIGGSHSHEFHVLASAGEDAIALSDASDYAANVDMAVAPVPAAEPATGGDMAEVATPGLGSIAEVAQHLRIEPARMVKTLVVAAADGGLVGLVVRGDHSLNEVKAAKLAAVAAPLRFASEAEIQAAIGCRPGSLGPLNLPVPLLVDHAAAALGEFVCGGNRDGVHLRGVNWQRDLGEFATADLRNIEAGEPSPCGRGRIRIQRGIEVGHIFQLGRKYSAALNLAVLDEKGRQQVPLMGCYGIGISRIVAAAIEQHHDEQGIIWPASIAPFDLALVPISMHKSTAVAAECERLYGLLGERYEVLFMDEPGARLGAMLADVELMGIPHRLVVGERGLRGGTIEYRGRRDAANRDIPREQILDFFAERLGS
ncbi:MAG: proline--tRNA ligase [Cellvibrionales bacterium]|nr:proline--tRNA ligase [Cellvibrionales bacterium]